MSNKMDSIKQNTKKKIKMKGKKEKKRMVMMEKVKVTKIVMTMKVKKVKKKKKKKEGTVLMILENLILKRSRQNTNPQRRNPNISPTRI